MIATRAGPPLAALTVALVLSGACASAASTPATAESGAAAPAAASGAPVAAPTAPPSPAQHVDVCVPGLSQDFAGVGIAQQAGYFAEAGLDVSIELVQGVACTQALSSGTVQFSGSPSTLDAILQGLPYRIVYVSVGSLGHQMVAAPRVNSWADLKGGRIAVSTLGSALSEGVARDMLRDQGLNPDQDVTFVALGTPNNRLSALLAGSVDGALLSSQEAPMGQAQGLKLLPRRPLTALGAPMTTNLDVIQSSPDLVQRFARAVLMGHLLYAERPTEALPLVQRWLDSPDPAYADEVYELVRPGWTADGTLSEAQMRQIISATAAAQKLPADVEPDQVFDFHFVEKAYPELQAVNWNGLWSQ